MNASGANRKSFLLVEDETLIRMMIADMLETLGHTVSAEAGTQVEALSLARDAAFDGAILDFNLGGPNSVPVAETIASRGIPFLFASGYVDLVMPLTLKAAPLQAVPIGRTRPGNQRIVGDLAILSSKFQSAVAASSFSPRATNCSAPSGRGRCSFINQLNRATGHRIKYLKVDADTGDEVPNEDIVKGYKVDTDTFIEVTKEEFENVALESTRTIEID